MSQFVYALIHGEDGCYGISFPDFPGCVSGGRSIDEAQERGRNTLAFHIRGMIEDGDPLPTLRTLVELSADPDFAGDANRPSIVAVPSRAVG